LRVPPLETDLPPSYVIGVPGRAAAVIVDNDSPRPTTSVLSDRSFHLTAPGVSGEWYRIEYSTDLQTWTPICTTQVAEGALHFVDPDAQDEAKRFYRAVPEPNPLLD
jgi:hypothetical protein